MVSFMLVNMILSVPRPIVRTKALPTKQKHAQLDKNIYFITNSLKIAFIVN